LALTIHSAQATNGAWTGTTDGNWNVDSNWTGAFYPGTGSPETATFNADVTNSTISMNSTAIAVSSISFTGSNTGSYTFNDGGGSLNVQNISIASNVTGVVTQTFNSRVNYAIGGNSFMANYSATALLDFKGGIDNASAATNLQFYVQQAGVVALNGASSNNGKSINISKQGIGKLIYTGTSTGAVSLSQTDGIVQYDSVGAMNFSGNGIGMSGGIIGLGAEDFTLTVASSGANTIRWSTTVNSDTGFAAYGANRNVNMGGAFGSYVWQATARIKTGQGLILGSADSTHTVNFQNQLGLADAARIIVVNDGVSSTNVDGEISGVISSPTASLGTVTKTGAGTLLLSAANTYTGLTTVSAGTLLVGNSSGDGSLAGGATLASGAILGGSGSIAGVVTIQSGARLAPGNSPGLLTVDNDVTIEDGGIFSVEVNGTTAGTGYDRLAMTGGGSDFSLTGSNDLEMSLGFTPAANALFFLVDNAGGSAISGIFESLNGVVTDLSQGALFSVGGQGFNISYTGDLAGNAFTGGDDLVIQAVPEPTTWVLMALGGLFLLGFRRRGVALNTEHRTSNTEHRTPASEPHSRTQ